MNQHVSSARPGLSACVCLLLLTPCYAEEHEDSKIEAEFTSEEVAAVERFKVILNAESEIDVIELPLQEVCQSLSKRHSVPIAIDYERIKPARLKFGTVTLNFKKVPLRTLLAYALASSGLGLEIRPTGVWAVPLPQIIHVAYLPVLSKSQFIASKNEAKDYAAYLDQAERRQQQEMDSIVEWGVKEVWLEGQTDKTIEEFRDLVAKLPKEKPGEEDADAYLAELLQIGAAGRLLKNGKLEKVLPLEDEEAWRAAQEPNASNQARLRRYAAFVDRLAPSLTKEGRALILLAPAHHFEIPPATVLQRVDAGGKLKFLVRPPAN
jgi:hypothetical protein